MEEIHEKVSDQLDKNDQNSVVLYNVASKKAFYTITTEEARYAIDFIKRVRTGLSKDAFKKNFSSDDVLVIDFLDRLKFKSHDEIMSFENFSKKETEKYSKLIGGTKLLENKNSSFGLDTLNKIFVDLESKGYIISDLCVNPVTLGDLKLLGGDIFFHPSDEEVYARKVFGHIWKARIRMKRDLPVNNIIVFGVNPDNLSEMAISHYVYEVNSDEDFVSDIKVDDTKELEIAQSKLKEVQGFLARVKDGQEKNRKILLVKVGNEDRPATPKDLKEVEDAFEKGIEKNAEVFITHHAIEMETVDMDPYAWGLGKDENKSLKVVDGSKME